MVEENVDVVGAEGVTSHYVKCNQSRPGFELVLLCPFPTTITITPRALVVELYYEGEMNRVD